MEIPATQIYDEDEALPATQRIGHQEAKDIRQVGVLIIGANTYAINKGVTTLGRHPSCTIVINDQTVSKQHAEIEASTGSAPSAWICDLKSANRTKLNNLVLQPGRSYEVQTGSVISLGRIRAVYKHHVTSPNLDESLIPETPDLRSRKQQIIPSTPDSSLNNSSGLDEPSTIPASQDGVFRRPSVPEGPNWSRNGDGSRNESRSENGISIHDLETQGQEEDIHEMETQKLCLVRPVSVESVNRRRSSVDLHEAETQKEEPELAKASGQTDFRSEPSPGGGLERNEGAKSQEVGGSRSEERSDRVQGEEEEEEEEGSKSLEDQLRLSLTSNLELDDDLNESMHYMGSQNVLELVAGPVHLEVPEAISNEAEKMAKEKSSDDENIFEMPTQRSGDQEQDDRIFEAPTQKIRRERGPPESQDDSDTDQEGVFLRYLRDSQTNSQEEPNFRRQTPNSEPEKPREPEQPTDRLGQSSNKPDQSDSAPAGTGPAETSLGREQPKNRPNKSISGPRRASIGPDQSAPGPCKPKIGAESAPSNLGSKPSYTSDQANLDISEPPGPGSRSTEPKNMLQPGEGSRARTREVQDERIPESEDSDTDKEGIFEELAQKAKRISLELTQAQGEERNDLGTSTDSYDLFEAATQRLNSSGEDLSKGSKEITKRVQSGPSLNMADRPSSINDDVARINGAEPIDDRPELIDDDAPTQVIRVAGFRLQEESLELAEGRIGSQGRKDSEDLDCLPTQLIGGFDNENGGDEECSEYEMAPTQVLSEVENGVEGSNGPNRPEDQDPRADRLEGLESEQDLKINRSKGMDKSKRPEQHGGGPNSLGSDDPRIDAAANGSIGGKDKRPGSGSARDSNGSTGRLSIDPPGCSRTRGVRASKCPEKVNLDDTIERNLNDLFQDANEGDPPEEVTQISTQTLQRVLQSSQVEPSSDEEENELPNRRSLKRKRRSLKNAGGFDLEKRASSLNKSSESESELNESDGDKMEGPRGSGKNRRRGSNRLGKSDRSRPDTSDRLSRSSTNRLEESDKVNRSGRLDKVEQVDGSSKLDRSSVNRLEEMDKPSRPNRMDKVDQLNRPNGSSKPDRSSVNSLNRLRPLDQQKPEVCPGSTDQPDEELSRNRKRGARAFENSGQTEIKNSNSIQTSLTTVDDSKNKNSNSILEKTSEDSTIMKDSDEDILAGLPEVRISGTLSNPGSPTTSVAKFRLELQNIRGRYERGRKLTKKIEKRTPRLEDYLEKDEGSSRTSSKDEEDLTRKVRRRRRGNDLVDLEKEEASSRMRKDEEDLTTKVRRSRRKDQVDLEKEEGSSRTRKDEQDHGRGTQDINRDKESTNNESTSRASKTKEPMNKPSRTKKSVSEVSTSKASTNEESTNRASITKQSTNKSSTTKESVSRASKNKAPTTKESTNKSTTKQPTNKASTTRESISIMDSLTTNESINQASTNRASTTKEPTNKSSATKGSTNKSSTNELTAEKSSGTKDAARPKRRTTTDFRELSGVETEATPWRRTGSQESTPTRMSQRQGGPRLIGSSVFQVDRSMGGKLATVTESQSVTLADGRQVELQTAVIKVVKMDQPQEVKAKEAPTLRRGTRRPKVLTEEVGQESQEVQMILQNGSGKDTKKDLDRIFKLRNSNGAVPEASLPKRRTRGSSVFKGPGPEESVPEERTKGPGPKESDLEERTKGPGPKESDLEERTSRTRGPASKDQNSKRPAAKEAILEERTSRTRGPVFSKGQNSKRPGPEESVLEESKDNPRVPRSEEKVTRRVKRTRSDSDSTESEKLDASLQQPKRSKRNKQSKGPNSLSIDDSLPREASKLDDDKFEVPRKRAKRMRAATGADLEEEEETSSSVNTSMEATKVTLNSPSVGRRSLSASFSSSPGRVRHRILFTGVPASEYTMFLTRLGASQVEDPDRCTVLVTDKVRRTVKFLCALALSVPIVSVEWLKESGKRGSWIEFEGYTLKDPVAEAKYCFRLRKSLEKARNHRLLDGYTIVLTTNVAPPPIPELKSIIQACGGKALVRAPAAWTEKSLILSREEDLQNARRILTKAPATVTIQSVEFLFTGILRQELDFVAHRLE